jgi:signal transduction histidine kinase
MTPQPAPDFRLLFESLPGPYLLVAPDLTIVAASDAYLRFVRLERETLIGRRVPAAFPDCPNNPASVSALDLAASLQYVLNHGIADTMDLQGFEAPRPASDGGGFEERFYRMVNTPISARDGTIAWVLHRVEDGTDLVRLKRTGADRERLAELLEKTLELDRLKTRFLANVSQEYRTAVKSILGLVEDARLRRDDTLDGEDLRAVHFNSLRLLKLANSMLDFARIDGGQIELTLQPTNLARLTQSLVEPFRPLIEKAGLELIVDCPPLPETVYVDRSIWEKIVVNLLSNAFKFTFEGSIAVSMEYASDHVVVLFRDTGTGIPQSELPHIFERFHRIPGARSRTYEGSGIGLALVHDLIQQHGGTIDVWSEEERGTTFRVNLPTGWRPREAPEDPPLSAPSKEPAQGHVLIVEDDPARRDYLSGLLSRRFRVTVAENGDAALTAIQRERPDAIVSEVAMPVIDGLTLVRSLRQHPETAAIPVILHSAEAGADSVTGVEAGADDCLGRSISGPELVARVRTHLELARIRRAAADAADKLAESRTALLRISDARNSDRDLYWDPISGEVREPLPHIAGLIEMIEMLFPVSLDASDKRYLNRIRPAELDRLIDDLLDFSRLSRKEMNKVPINLSSLAEEVIVQLKAKETSPPPTLWTFNELPTVHADAAMLRVVLVHLISNAMKFASRSSPRQVTVGVAKPTDSEDVFCVEDNGIGFNMEHAGRLFGVFQRLHSHDNFEGAGIGLAIVRQIIQKLGGRTWAEGTAGGGATFYCSLPRDTKTEQESNP